MNVKSILVSSILFFSLHISIGFSQINDIHYLPKLKGLHFLPGYFNCWWDNNNGKVWMEVSKLQQEFLYVTSLPAGLGSNDIGLDRGLISNTKIVQFKRIGKKLLLVQPNQDYRANSTNIKEQTAVKESFAQSIIASFAIEDTINNSFIIDITNFITRDAIGIADRIKSSKQGSYQFNESRSAVNIENTKNFPYNTELDGIITFTGGSDAGKWIQAVVPSSEAITLRIHHSFVQLPDDNYKPRKYDIRSGYFGISYYNFSSPFSEQIQQLYINRHRLEKTNPDLPICEPIKPIIYYLDNGTPEPIRSALLEGAKWWNKAFESAGFLNAFQVKILPDSADPMDIRYNMINWVHRSTRGWSYGMTVTDPRTGEIIKGNVTLGSLRVRQDFLIFSGLLPLYNGSDSMKLIAEKTALQRLKQLAAHEVGHTLGLMHNYASSYNNRASVMDYPHPHFNINKNGQIDFANAYTNEIGEWDKQAIKYGYTNYSNDKDEYNGLLRILEENTQKGLLYISDVDARSVSGMHPSAHLWDNDQQPINELNNVLTIRKKALENFSEKNLPLGTPLAKLEDLLVPIYNFHRYQLEAVCKLIGGIDYTYTVRTNENKIIQKPLDNRLQKQALSTAINCLKADVLSLSPAIINLIPPRPPMYYNIGELFAKRTGLSFDPLSAAEALVDYEMDFLMNPERANRLVQMKKIYNTIGWDDVLEEVFNNIFHQPLTDDFQGEINKQTQQMVLTYLIGLLQSDKTNYSVKSITNYYIQKVNSFAKVQIPKKDGNHAHYNYLLDRISHQQDVKLPSHKEIAPGAPIGCDIDY